ncbi:Wall-associated receptor kinase 5 [Apostasia shenzhenica]|uniref:Wall-associated receptor kinase 5 n=1 Tax=Apostasia shenzhenica TaxID=1088818 RepID=A0A2H9ZSI6_9ASPA|nr:Wall-associated receptor kinase 5 [Apostasia shenzhenica]
MDMKQESSCGDVGSPSSQRQAPSCESIPNFTAEELERATDGYSESRVVGHGDSSTVYKGILPGNNHVVAIKKWFPLRRIQVDQFTDEVKILFKLNHNHLVRILGCSLETPVPILVYEYVPNGTLHHHIHDRPGSLSWEARLRIAGETAGAVACVHSAIPGWPTHHRGIRSVDILLNNDLTAKVSDFAARLDRADCLVLERFFHSMKGYLEPDFFLLTSRLTQKSDVYCFGVVLAELLTGQKPVSAARTAEDKNLGVFFLKNLREGTLFEMLEARVREEGRPDAVKAVAEVAGRCLMPREEERPTMREIAEELQSIRRLEKNAWAAEAPDNFCSTCAGESGSDNGRTFA